MGLSPWSVSKDSGKSRKIELDITGFGEDLTKLDLVRAGEHHLIKRLDLMSLIFGVLDVGCKEMKGIKAVEMRGFKASSYYVPEGYTNGVPLKRPLQRMHISFIPQIVVIDDKGSSQVVRGVVKVNGKETSFENLLEVVDIGHAVINDVDSVIESAIRPQLADLVLAIIQGEITPKEAGLKLRSTYVETMRHFLFDYSHQNMQLLQPKFQKMTQVHYSFIREAFGKVCSLQEVGHILGKTISRLEEKPSKD